MQKSSTYNLTILALFIAIILLMAYVPFLGYINLGFINATILQVPVVIGSIVLGPKKGAILGGVFGLTSLINNTIKPNATSFVFSPFLSANIAPGNIGVTLWCIASSLIICMLPRVLTGVTPFYVRKVTKKLPQSVSMILAGLLGALTNTLLVMNLIYLLFGQSYAMARNTTIEVLYNLIAGIIFTVGIPEAIVTAILTLAVCKALGRVLKQNL